MDYRIQLDAYAGPLDLLLHLVKRNEIDLHDIPIAELTEQYLAHLQLLQDLDMDQAGEFLVMAATLLEIKSQMIVPRPEEAEEDEAGEGEESSDEVGDPTDPRYELVQQLLAYKRYKDAASQLEQRQEDWAARFAVRPIDRAKPDKDESEAELREIELEDVNVFELCEAFGRLLSSIGEFSGHSVTDDDTPIGLHAEDIADRLQREGPMTLRRICEGRNRAEVIGLFLAMLELVRDKRVAVVQDESEIGRDVRLELMPEKSAEETAGDDEATDWRDPETGEMQYDWPDERARRRFERRQQRRQRRFEKGDFTSDDDDDLDDDDFEDDEAPEDDLDDDKDA